MKYRYSLLDEEAPLLEANKASNRVKAPFCMLVSASLLALETCAQGERKIFLIHCFLCLRCRLFLQGMDDGLLIFHNIK